MRILAATLCFLWLVESNSQPPDSSPQYYVSFVMASRVDDLRGDSVGRLRNAVELLQHQCDSHALNAELIIVEWNPFPDKPTLADSLSTSISPSSRTPVRIITVPPALHTSVEAGTGQTFFEFLAKNAGARRARGEFILITNPDVLLNDAVIAAIARKRLDPDAYFRIPRVELGSAVDPFQPFQRRREFVEGLASSGLSPQPVCDVGERFCPGAYNDGICERGFLGPDRHGEHHGLADSLFLPAAGDFFLTHRDNFFRVGGYPDVPSTTHLDSLLLCKIVLLRPCLMFHQKHPARDLHGHEVSDACTAEMETAGQCRRRFVLAGWELTDDKCEEAEAEMRHRIKTAGNVDDGWGFAGVELPEETL